ncbi:MAG: hypothetical protein ACI8RZ_001450 [Myxococcota bacterium]|jgi:hypothetical protein
MIHFLLATAYASTPQQISQWISTQTAPGQADELGQFGDLPEGYPNRLTTWVRSQLARSASMAVARFQEGTCQESTRLRVLTPGLTGVSEGPLADHFEGSIFRLESTGCLPGASLEDVTRLYHSEAFRLAEMPGLDGIDITDNSICLFSDAVPGILSSTRFCLNTDRHTADGLHLTHAALRENQHPAGQTMFLREEVVVFAAVPDGVGVYRVTFTRAQELGTASKMVLERTAKMAQGRIYRALEEWMDR